MSRPVSPPSPLPGNAGTPACGGETRLTAGGKPVRGKERLAGRGGCHRPFGGDGELERVLLGLINHPIGQPVVSQ